jgi:hypothetical protein
MRKTDVRVGYLSVNVLRLWHSAIDCASFGLFSEISLEVEAVAKMLGVGLPKQQKLQSGCLHILEYKVNGTKQYA